MFLDLFQDFNAGESNRITPASSSSVLYDILIFTLICITFNYYSKNFLIFCLFVCFENATFSLFVCFENLININNRT